MKREEKKVEMSVIVERQGSSNLKGQEKDDKKEERVKELRNELNSFKKGDQR